MSKHLSDEDLILRLYEIGSENSHVDRCEECRERWRQLVVRRREVLVDPHVPADLLANQRRTIYRRLDEDNRNWFWSSKPIAALAALSVVMAGIVLLKSTSSPPPSTSMLASNDSQFYTEIYSMLESTGPDAAQPIYGLFEEEQR